MKANTCHNCGKPSSKVLCSVQCRINDKKGTWVKNPRGVTVLVVERKKG